MGHPLVFVEGNSEDYIFGHSKVKGKWQFTDYGSISDSGFLELLFEYWETKDVDFKNHLLKRLARRLNVKLRRKPLTMKQIEKLEGINMAKFEKEHKDLLKIEQNRG